MRVISFNVNGLRARLHQLRQVIDTHKPDVIGLQETKVSDEEFPVEDIESLGYQVNFHGQKGHYGVALLSKLPAISVRRGFPEDTCDTQRRLISCDYRFDSERITVINGYFPQGESRAHPSKYPAKEQFYASLRRYLDQQYRATDKVVVMGDMNVAPEELDVGIKPENAKRWVKTGKCAFLPEERQWLGTLCDWGLTDTYRHQNGGDATTFSWFDYRSGGFQQEPKRGLRIDLILASTSLLDCLHSTGIDYAVRGSDKPSDHCPVWAQFSL